VAALTEEQRARLSDSDFAVPHKRALPIHDAEHAKLAWDMLSRTEGLTSDEREDARHRIVRALHRHGVKFAQGVEESGARQLTGYFGGDESSTRALEAKVVDEAQRVVEVTIVRPGVSDNGYVYAESVLREAVGLWNGAPAFLDHPTALDLTRAGSRSLRDLVGVYENPAYAEGRGIRARLRLSANDHGAFETIREAVSARASGRAVPPIGISADWRLLSSPVKPGPDGRQRRQVHAITAVNSGDLVVRPSAGGSFDRIVEGSAAIVADYTSWVPWEVVTVPDGATASAAKSDVSRLAESAGVGSTTVQPLGGDPTLVLPGSGRREVERLVWEALAPVQAQLRGAQLEAKLAAAKLPESAAGFVRGQFPNSRVFEASEVDAAIAAVKDMLGGVFGQQSIRGVGAFRPDVQVGQSALDRVQASMDRLFGLPLADALSATPRFTGIREAYVTITGDKFFTGNYVWSESVVREANEVTTSVLANVVLNSMTKRLVRDYQAQPKWWEPIVIKTPVLDMKQQNRIRLLDFASLSSVSEDAAYTNIAWGDARENYTPTKFGNLVVVTLETFLNDDVHAVTRIPTKIAHAATVTINEQVATLFTQSSGTGPTLSDTFHVFDSANHQGNTSNSTPAYDLSSSSLQNAMTALEKIQNSASKRIGVRGRYLLIPPDLRWTAAVITQSQYASGTANNDINPLAGAIVPIVVPQFTTTYQWYLLADPSQIESLEVGFLNGREEPELLVQDNPTQGAVFTNDAISYKVRHIYGAGWLDYRGAFAALPTS
jgi:hypothetical protein